MLKKTGRIFSFIIIVFTTKQLNAQAFLNGDFEINTAAVCDYNMANATWNTEMANSVAYGAGNELDIMQTSCPYGPSQNGTWFAALAFPTGSDAFTMQLSAPLVAGTTYSMSFWDKGDVACCPPGMPVVIGISTVAGAAGTTVYTGPTPTGGVWIQRCFTFVAPNSGQHVSVSTTGPTRWSHVDNFILNGSCTVLPIELMYLKSVCNNKSNVITWATATERNNHYFSVEFSTDGKDFIEIGKVNGAGNSNVETKYQFTDFRHEGVQSYYRLKQIDFDKKFSYSLIVGTEKCKPVFDFQFDIFPNPANDHLNITTNALETKLIITDPYGKIIYENNGDANQTSIDVSQFGKGLYFVQMINDGRTQTKKFIKN